jgi:hypothetical protein
MNEKMKYIYLIVFALVLLVIFLSIKYSPDNKNIDNKKTFDEFNELIEEKFDT